jgi:hypothetical protein
MKRILLGIALAALMLPMAGCYVVYDDPYYRPYPNRPYSYRPYTYGSSPYYGSPYYRRFGD